MKLVILAGGTGSRLWPVSRRDKPKQVKPIIGDKTLLNKTYERLRRSFPSKNIYVATNEQQLPLIQKQLVNFPGKNYIVEPAKKDTAAAIGLAAAHLYKQNKREIMININSDHFIKDEKEYLRLIRLSEKVVAKKPKSGTLIGVNPTYPETGLGYIKMGEQVMEVGRAKVFNVESFEEKPDLKTARKYVEGWEYLWNIGSFVWRVDTLLDHFKRFLPHTHKQLMKIKDAIGTKDEDRLTKRYFRRIEPISIDYGIIEHVSGLLVMPGGFGWADIGNWGTVKDILSKTPKSNIKKGKIISVDCNNNLIYNYTDKLVTALGVKNMIIIKTEDTTLVCPKDKAHDVKKIVKKLKTPRYEKYL